MHVRFSHPFILPSSLNPSGVRRQEGGRARVPGGGQARKGRRTRGDLGGVAHKDLELGRFCVGAGGPEAGLLFEGGLPSPCTGNGLAHYTGAMRVSCAHVDAQNGHFQNGGDDGGGGGGGQYHDGIEEGARERCVSTMTCVDALPVTRGEAGVGDEGHSGGLCLHDAVPSCPSVRNSSWARQYLGNYDGNKWLFNFFARYAVTLWVNGTQHGLATCHGGQQGYFHPRGGGDIQ